MLVSFLFLKFQSPMIFIDIRCFFYSELPQSWTFPPGWIKLFTSPISLISLWHIISKLQSTVELKQPKSQQSWQKTLEKRKSLEVEKTVVWY